MMLIERFGALIAGPTGCQLIQFNTVCTALHGICSFPVDDGETKQKKNLAKNWKQWHRRIHKINGLTDN